MREVVTAFLDRIERVDGTLNAICTLRERDAILADADAHDAQLAGREAGGRLFGLPIAVKDLMHTAGMRTTYGSPLLSAFVPKEDGLLVERLRGAGAIVIGKTNVPEFGAGSHTFNPIFGTTRNPYDPPKSCGGSSGGAAVALAARMVPLADGSDLGGSLRNPAGWCNVVGFRPSLGRVPSWPVAMGFQSRLATEGPMARTVADAAWLLSVLAGPDPRDPISIDEPGDGFAVPLDRDLSGLRIAWGGDLGFLPCDPEILAVCEASLSAFETIGARVEPARPDLSDAMEVFQVQRALSFAQVGRGIPRAAWPKLKDTVVWNIEKGLALGVDDVIASDLKRTEIHHRMRAFFDEHDALVLPTTQLPPFDAELEYPTEIAGQRLDSYIDWMASCCVITVTGHPAISVPCGFTKSGLPVGLQIVGRHRGDRALLELAHGFEQATGCWRQAPPLD